MLIIHWPYTFNIYTWNNTLHDCSSFSIFRGKIHNRFLSDKNEIQEVGKNGTRPDGSNPIYIYHSS